MTKHERCRNCGEEIYYSTAGRLTGGEWRHHRNAKKWCAVSLVGPTGKTAEPGRAKGSSDVTE